MSDVLEELVTKFTYDVDQAGLNKFLRGREKINRNTKTMIGLNTTLSKVMRRLFFGAGAIIGINSLIKTYRGIDLIRRSIEGLTKSTQDWDYIQKEALRTGTDIEQVAKGYRNFYSAASMAGFDKSGIQEMYSDVLTASRAIGATQQQVGGALLALEQMLSKGKVSMEELRRQLGNALPGAFEIGAKAMGVTTQKFNDMVKKGLSAAEFVPKFTKELLNTYQEAFPEAIKSLDFAMVNLSTSWKLFQYEIMNGKAGEEIANFLNKITEFLRSPEAISMAKGIGQALQLVVKGLEFIIKHFKMILFIWGVNSLMGGIRWLYNLRQGIIGLANDIAFGSASLGGALNNIVFALSNILTTGGGVKALISAIGKALIPIGRSMLWITAIAAALYGIYLLLEDIFTYINHPEWESFTKDLVEQFPIIGDMIEDMKKTFKDLQPMLNDLSNAGKELMKWLLEYIKAMQPAMVKMLKIDIALLTGLLWILTQIIKALEWMYSLGKKLKDNPTFDYLQSYSKWGVPGLIYTKIKHNKENSALNNPISPQVPMPLGSSYLNNGMNLSKIENDSKTITNYVTIQAQNHSVGQISDIVSNIIGGTLDSLNNTINPVPQKT